MNNERVNLDHIHIGPKEDRCIFCGEIVPEGREICPNCWEKYFDNK